MSELDALDPDRIAPDDANPVVADVMRREVVFCLPSTPIDAIAKLMADNELSEVPVLIDRRPVGYVGARDILDQLVEGRIVLAGSDVVRQQFVDVLARHVLRTPVLTVDERAQIEDVIALMRQQGRQTALVMHEDDVPVGLITAREVAEHLSRQLAPTPVTVHG